MGASELIGGGETYPVQRHTATIGGRYQSNRRAGEEQQSRKPERSGGNHQHLGEDKNLMVLRE
jgi:hypothetical protein